MRYTKPSKSKSELAQLIISRGLKGSSRKELETLFTFNSYYRMSGYWLQFKKLDDTLNNENSYSKIHEIYCFDRDLRLLVLRSIQLIENCLRATFINYYATEFTDLLKPSSADSDPFAYLYHWFFPSVSKEDHEKRIDKLHVNALYSNSKFIDHYFSKYTQEDYLPVWMAVESSSFGTLVYLCKNAETKFKQNLGSVFDVSHDVLESWIVALRKLRNCAAHHERIWDTKFKQNSIMLPKQRKYPKWHFSTVPKRSTLLFRIIVLEYLVSKIPFAQFSVYNELCKIVDTYTEVPFDKTGFVEDWRSCALWYD